MLEYSASVKDKKKEEIKSEQTVHERLSWACLPN